MKKLQIIFILFLFCRSLNAQQSAYYDAKYLKDSCLPETGVFYNPSNLKKVFKKYYPNLINDSSNSELLRTLKTNPFLIKFVPDGESFTEFNSTPFKDISYRGIAGLNVSAIADGIAQFLIKRGKEELDAAFFNQMKNFLEKHDECKILFPSTVEFLTKIDPYKYSAFLQSLREAFHKDLSNLIIHLNQVIDLPKYQDLNSGIRLAVRSANIVSELSQSGQIHFLLNHG